MELVPPPSPLPWRRRSRDGLGWAGRRHLAGGRVGRLRWPSWVEEKRGTPAMTKHVGCVWALLLSRQVMGA